MGGLRQIQRWPIFAGLTLAVLASAPAATKAAWLGYKNNTNAVVIIQATDLVVLNGQVTAGRAGKAHALYPGEVAWDPIAAPGPRMITIYDGKQKTHVLFQDKVDCKKNDIFLSLQLVQPQAVRGQAPPSQLNLLPTVLPAQAPGILAPGSMPPNPSPSGGRPPTPPNTSRPPGH